MKDRAASGGDIRWQDGRGGVRAGFRKPSAQGHHQHAIPAKGTRRDEDVRHLGRRRPSKDALAECQLIQVLGPDSHVGRARQASQPCGIDRPVVGHRLELPRRIVRQAGALNHARPKPQ